MPQGFQGWQIIGVSLQDVAKRLPRLFIISKPAICFGAAPGGLYGTRIEDKRRVKGVIGNLIIGMGERSASASDGNGGGDGAMIERTQKMIGAIGIIHV